MSKKPDKKHDLDYFVQRFERLVKAAGKAGINVCVDAGACAIRLIPSAEAAAATDLRGLGETVSVHDGCGGGGASVSGEACNYGVK